LRRTRLALALDAGTSPEKDDQIYLMRYLASATELQAAHAAGILAAATCYESGTPADHYTAAAAKSFDESADHEVIRHLEGLYWLARAESVTGRYDAAFQHCGRGLRLAEERRMGGMVPKFACALGSLQLSIGDLNGATRHAACARAAAAATGSDHLLAIAVALEERISGPEMGMTECSAGESRADLTASQERNKPAETVNPVADSEPDRYQAAAGKLSERETEIAFLVSYGKTNQQIARLLGLSHKTVETYLARIFNKLTVSCRAEVAAIISRAGITPPDGPALSTYLVRRGAALPPGRVSGRTIGRQLGNARAAIDHPSHVPTAA
jgi:DNA-binding CsgD family transcriptional regulator